MSWWPIALAVLGTVAFIAFDRRARKRHSPVGPRRIELTIKADEPALFYASAAAAEEDLEAVDVRNGLVRAAYGRHGEIYRVDAIGDRVTVVLDPSKPADPDGLKQVLAAFLKADRMDAEVDADLEELLLRCERSLR